ncbi:MAG: hypothetical protein IRZ11_05350 [Clostridia bacterium]|nr:hypothetical protein [Clostridia bacterium]
MSERTLAVEVVTPERRVYRGRARMLVAKGVMGELGVLPGHIPLVTQLVDGDVRLHQAEGEVAADGPDEDGSGARARQVLGDLTFRCEGGFLVVDGEGARVLAERAEAPAAGRPAPREPGGASAARG